MHPCLSVFLPGRPQEDLEYVHLLTHTEGIAADGMWPICRSRSPRC